MPHGASDERRETANGSNLANKRVKAYRPYKNTNEHGKSQHAPNLAHCGALGMEGTRAKEPINVHNARRPPKTPHIKRKHMRTSKNTHERQTRHTGKKCAHHGKGGEGEREPNSNAPVAMRAGTHCKRNTGTEGAPARPPQIAQAAPRWRGTRTRRACRSYEKSRFPHPFFLSLGLIYILYFLCFFLSFLAAIVRKQRISSHFLRTLRNLNFLPRMQDFSSAAIPYPSDPPTSTPRTAFTANVIRKNYEVNAHFRKCYESQLEPIMPDYKQLSPFNRIFLLFPLFSSRFLAFSLVLPFLFASRFS